MIEFCLVGGGFIGPLHAANIAAHPGARLRWVVDLNLPAAEANLQRAGKLQQEIWSRAVTGSRDDPTQNVPRLLLPALMR